MSAEAAEPQHRQLVVADAGAGERIDRWLADAIPELSRARIAQLLADGQITVDGAPARKSRRVEPGERIDVLLPAPTASSIEAQALPLTIVHEDADLLVIDKAAGMVVHPAAGHREGTLVNALLHHVRDLSGIGGVLRPGIVHRLDKDTSGLLLVAKHDDAHRALAGALKRREIRRIYLAAAWGHLAHDEQRVDAPIGRSPTHRRRMAVREDGRAARTRFVRLERWRAADLLRAELDTGRTHQIRVHLAHLGHPVVGDELYGAGGARGISGPDHRWAREFERRVERQFLHATELAFRHPRSGEAMRFQSPLPAELAAAAEWARTTQRAG